MGTDLIGWAIFCGRDGIRVSDSAASGKCDMYRDSKRHKRIEVVLMGEESERW